MCRCKIYIGDIDLIYEKQKKNNNNQNEKKNDDNQNKKQEESVCGCKSWRTPHSVTADTPGGHGHCIYIIICNIIIIINYIILTRLSFMTIVCSTDVMEID